MTIKEIHDLMVRNTKDAQELNDKVLAESREYTAEEQEQSDKIDNEYERLVRAKESLEKIDKRSQMIDSFHDETDSALSRIASPNRNNEDPDGEKRIDDFYRLKNCSLVEIRAMNTTDDSSLIADKWLAKLIRFREEAAVLYSASTVIKYSGGTLTVPYVSAVTETIGVTEAAAFTDKEETFSEITLDPVKRGAKLPISSETLEDAMFNVEQIIGVGLRRALTYDIENQLAVGDGGTNNMNGVFATAGTGLTAASATAVTADELLELQASIATPYWRDSQYVMNLAVLTMIRKLKHNGQYIFVDAVRGAAGTIHGSPYLVCADAPAATTGLKPILFGDLKQFYIAEKRGVRLQKFTETLAANDQTLFTISARMDSKIADTAALKVMLMA